MYNIRAFRIAGSRLFCAALAAALLALMCGCGETDGDDLSEQTLSQFSITSEAQEQCVAEDILPDGIQDSARAAIVWCADNSRILYGHNIHEKRPIASITKIMTALICLEYAAADNKAVRITPEMYAEGSSMYLKAGEIISLRELVKGMMAVSGNDAANAAASAVAGSNEKFAALMNRRAKQLGMNNTHFTTPSGLDMGEHYSTAYDMALLCAYAMENETFRSIVGKRNITAEFISPEGKTQQLCNHNKLLSICSGCIGIKTGFTKKAGRTLTSCAEREGIRLIIVTLCDGNDWDDHCSLYDSCFSRLEKIRLCGRETKISIPLAGGKENEKQIVRVPERELFVVAEKNSRNKTKKPEQVIYAPAFIYSPAVRGRKYGRIEYLINGKTAASCALVPQ